MEKRTIGNSDLEVSQISLGSMTFGGETGVVDAEAQLNFALERGINLIDTAELYPAPYVPNSFGRSEAIIGNWMKKQRNRGELIISTKAAGPGDFINWVRNGRSNHNKENLFAAVEGSLRRLKTDYIDLFHLHWPDRAIQANDPFFKPPKKELNHSFGETMNALNELTASGKIRFVGVSNESAWGVLNLLEHQKSLPLVKIISIQNSYNLIDRKFEYALAEIAHHKNLGLLAYSPLAMGLLTDHPSDSLEAMRRKKKRNVAFNNYCSGSIRQLRNALTSLAESEGIELKRMALEFVLSRPFTASAILGSTNINQLRETLSIKPNVIPKHLEQKINNIYEEYHT